MHSFNTRKKGIIKLCILHEGVATAGADVESWQQYMLKRSLSLTTGILPTINALHGAKSHYIDISCYPIKDTLTIMGRGESPYSKISKWFDGSW